MTKAKKTKSPEAETKEKTFENFKGDKNNFSLKDIKPLNESQDKVFDAYFQGYNLIMSGSAGTGKTYLALYLALNDLLQNRCRKIMIIRSAVTTRDQGFLPGTLDEKMAVYEAPYVDICDNLLGRGDVYGILKKRGYLDFMSTSFIRGLTFNDTVFVIDESQNLSMHEIESVLTRVGKRCKVLICGDSRQNDLEENKKNREKSGLSDMIKIADKMDSFASIEFGLSDIVRSGFCKEFLIAKHYTKLD